MECENSIAQLIGSPTGGWSRPRKKKQLLHRDLEHWLLFISSLAFKIKVINDKTDSRVRVANHMCT